VTGQDSVTIRRQVHVRQRTKAVEFDTGTSLPMDVRTVSLAGRDGAGSTRRKPTRAGAVQDP